MKNSPTASPEKALWVLKTRGSQPLTMMAVALGMTTEGARFQLLKLSGEGLVEAISESKGRGRPQQIWSLTPLGHKRFPDTHAELTVRMIQKMREVLGEEALNTVITAGTLDNITRYKEALQKAPGLKDKVRLLTEIRDREGYMAEYQKDKEGFLLIENHCPICAAAETCQGFCQGELETFQTVLGPDATVERTSHILSGARRCIYRIK